MVLVCCCGISSRTGIFTDGNSAFLKAFKPLITLRLAHTVLPVFLVKELKYLCKMFTKFTTKFTHTSCSSNSSIVTLSLNRRTVCARAQFSGCSWTTNGHTEWGKRHFIVKRGDRLLLVAATRSVLVGELINKYSLFLNTPIILVLFLNLTFLQHEKSINVLKIYSQYGPFIFLHSPVYNGTEIFAIALELCTKRQYSWVFNK